MLPLWIPASFCMHYLVEACERQSSKDGSGHIPRPHGIDGMPHVNDDRLEWYCCHVLCPSLFTLCPSHLHLTHPPLSIHQHPAHWPTLASTHTPLDQTFLGTRLWEPNRGMCDALEPSDPTLWTRKGAFNLQPLERHPVHRIAICYLRCQDVQLNTRWRETLPSFVPKVVSIGAEPPSSPSLVPWRRRRRRRRQEALPANTFGISRPSPGDGRRRQTCLGLSHVQHMQPPICQAHAVTGQSTSVASVNMQAEARRPRYTVHRDVRRDQPCMPRTPPRTAELRTAELAELAGRRRRYEGQRRRADVESVFGQTLPRATASLSPRFQRVTCAMITCHRSPVSCTQMLLRYAHGVSYLGNRKKKGHPATARGAFRRWAALADGSRGGMRASDTHLSLARDTSGAHACLGVVGGSNDTHAAQASGPGRCLARCHG